MSVHLNKEIDRLKKLIANLCSMVDENMRQSVLSLLHDDVQSAKKIIEKDHEIDTLEIEVEEECLKILALHQPVAIDLRYVVACLKMNNDLERIGDLSAGIAKVTIAVSNTVSKKDFQHFHIPEMVKKTERMLKDSMDALFNIDSERAHQVCNADDEVDKLNEEMHKHISEAIQKEPEKADYLMRLLRVSKNLERIADYATNIAEDILYMINGEIMRHSSN